MKKILLFAGLALFLTPVTAKADQTFVDPKGIPLTDILSIPDGSDTIVENGEVKLTSFGENFEKKNQAGAIFSNEENKLDLRRDFYSEMYVYMWGRGEGVTFVLHNDPASIKQFSGLWGPSLGIYGDKFINENGKWKLDPNGPQLKKSFAIEMDILWQGTGLDQKEGWALNVGHMAHTFPDKTSTYSNDDGKNPIGPEVRYVNHLNVANPPLHTWYFGDGKWRVLKVKWKSWDASNNGKLTYQYGDMPPVTATINRDTFGTDNVYWGFTATTGDKHDELTTILESKAMFKTVPGLVYYDDQLEILNKNGDVIESTKQNSEVTIQYKGKYSGGKQDLLNPTYKFTLSPKQKYQTGTFYLNNQPVTPTISGNDISIPLKKNLTLQDSEIDIKFNVKDSGITADTELPVNMNLAGDNFISDASTSYNIKYTTDNTAPTGTGKLTFVDKGDTDVLEKALDYKSFLTSYQDNVTPKDKIKVTLKKGQDFATIVGSLGPSSFDVILTDEAGNFQTVTVPLFIQNSQVAKSSQYLIYGEDFSVTEKEYPKTEAALLTMIREKSGLKLWSYTEQAVTVMDNKLADVTLEKLPSPVASGVYEVTVSYGQSTAKVEKKINITISQSFATVKVLHLIDGGIGIEVPGVTNPPTVTGEFGEAYSIPKFDSPDYLLSKVTVDGVEQPTSNVPVTGIYGDTKEVIFYYQNKPKLSASLAISKPSILEGEKVTFTSQIKNTAEDPSLLTNVVYTTTNAFPENVNVNLDTVKVNDKPITAGKAKLGTDRKLTIDLGDLTPMTDYKVTYEVESKKKVPPLTTTVKVEQAYTLKGESIGGTEVTGDSGAVKSFTINPGKAILDVFYYEETDNDIEYIDQDDTREATAGEKVTIYPKDMPGYRMTKVVINNEKTILAEDLPVTKEVEVEYGKATLVEYYYVGLLEFKSAPTMYDFGVVEGSIQKSKFQPQSVEGSLIVSDSRTDKQPWTLKAKVTTPLHHTEKENLILPEAIKYKNVDDVVALNDSSRAIIQQQNTSKEYDVTKERWTKGEGFFLEFSAGELKSHGKYQAEIEITLENAK
ncbi:lectin-like domain-containing protein [Enterococcus ureasiticus]|uniref:WxL domain-containing protein n=1 Tax=Enterococcus ureasiticus TaxID=903984 RepID=A0A1E5GAH8_9ENTE|nr:hypothetical protein [Enterococcus ureasiticus]OEG09726.1 hypothetical protein BCR21_15415 [Enterococcus ureasiticus]